VIGGDFFFREAFAFDFRGGGGEGHGFIG
jgi:hypothetical protein